MTNAQIEAWVREIVERVGRKAPVEDSRVELKADWIDASKAARQLAGHANAATGEPILWLIGVDESKGVTGVSTLERSNWLAAVSARFDDGYPSAHDLNVEIDEKVVVALLFHTDRAPFVVRASTPGQVSHELPWREGTSTRSARRADLIRLVAQHQRLPLITLLGGNASHEVVHIGPGEGDYGIGWTIELMLYVVPHAGEPVVIPQHGRQCTVHMPPLLPPTEAWYVRLEPPSRPKYRKALAAAYGDNPDLEESLTVSASTYEVFVTGPGRVQAVVFVETPILRPPQWGDLDLALVLTPVRAAQSIRIAARLRYRPESANEAFWILDDDSSSV